MKRNQTRGIATLLAATLLMLLYAGRTLAQAKVADKEIIGVWIMTSMKFEGENKELVGPNYNQVKVYRANGEYACAEIVKGQDGTYIILPHEYGTYSLKNGKYVEMGRNSDPIDWIDKTSFKGRWKNRRDRWRKVTDMPASLTQHVVDKCKAAQESPEDMQKLMKRYIFTK